MRLVRSLLLFLAFGFSSISHVFAASSPSDECQKKLQNLNPEDPDLLFYEAYRIRNLKPKAEIKNFVSATGIFLKRNCNGQILRHSDGSPVEARIRVLTDNPKAKLSVIGDFNQWGKASAPNALVSYDLHPIADSPYHEGVIPGLKHGDHYRLVVDGTPMLDPSASFFSLAADGTTMNSVFWDFNHPGAYVAKHSAPDLRKSALTIGEIEPLGLVSKFPRKDQSGLGPATAADTFAFIGDPDTGFMDKFHAEFGYNAVHLLPINQSISGTAWQHRYQVYGNFAPDFKFGTPDSFAQAVDAFNARGTAVILDYLGSHFPYKSDGLATVGLSAWQKSDGHSLFGRDETEWQTKRYDYENPAVRRFLIDGALTMFQRYHVGGLRIDNASGIVAQTGGRAFLQELRSELRDYRPDAIVIYEDFYSNEWTKSLDDGGFGGHGRNDDGYFGQFVRDQARKSADDLNLGILQKVLRSEWDSRELGRVAYITNHDEAANYFSGATGAYFPSLIDGGGDFHSYGKTRVFAGVAQTLRSYSEDTPQLRLLQRGTMNTDREVDWNRLNDPQVANISHFFATVATYVNHEPAFAFENLHREIENHTDPQNKIISLYRIDKATGKKIYILANFSPNEFYGYTFGVEASHDLKIEVNSDAKIFGGSNRNEDQAHQSQLPVKDEGFHAKSHSLTVPYVAPYSLMIFSGH